VNELTAVVPEEPVIRANPDVARSILQKAVDCQIGQTFGGAVLP
jgi:hypothetical protein